MPKLKPGTIWPTDEEEARIQAGIAADPEARELTGEEWSEMRPAAAVLPELLARYLEARSLALSEKFIKEDVEWGLNGSD